MKRILKLIIALALLAAPLGAADEKVQIQGLPTASSVDEADYLIVSQSGSVRKSEAQKVRRWPSGTTLPANCAVGDEYVDTDATYKACVCTATNTWTCPGAGGGGNSFETINAPSGTDPVADSSTDTLNLTAGSGITITGDSSTDTVTIAATGGGGEAGPMPRAFLHVREEQAATTNAGASTSGSWATRTLNTVVTNTITGASLSANQFTLPAGTYSISARVPAFRTETHQARLYNVTDASVTLVGSSAFTGQSSAVGWVHNESWVVGVFTITAEKVFRLEHRVSNSQATYGLGVAASHTTEVYSEVLVEKVYSAAEVAPFGQYDPDNPPASASSSDEFTSGTSLTWSWGNQEASTATAEMGGLTLLKPADATGLTAYLTTGPDGSTTDWTMAAKMPARIHVAASNFSGLVLIATGTGASPTLLYTCGLVAGSTTATSFIFYSYTSYTSGATSHGASSGWDPPNRPMSGYLAMRYLTATKTLDCLHSHDGKAYISLGTATLAAHPTTTMGFQNSANNATYGALAHFEFIRFWTSALGGTSPSAGRLVLPIGE